LPKLEFANRACEQCGVAIVHNYSRSLPNPSRSQYEPSAEQ
jgi:hypothetical protein